MHAVCEDFDKYFSAWNQDVYRLCFAMVGKAGDARDLTFKTFLRLGAAKDPEMKEKRRKKPAFFKLFYALRRFIRPKDAPHAKPQSA